MFPDQRQDAQVLRSQCEYALSLYMITWVLPIVLSIGNVYIVYDILQSHWNMRPFYYYYYYYHSSFLSTSWPYTTRKLVSNQEE